MMTEKTMTETDIKSMVAQILAELAGSGATTSAQDVVVEADTAPDGTPKVPHPANPAALDEMVKATAARIAQWRAGPRPTCAALLRFRADHAAAMDAVFNDVSAELPTKLGLVCVQSAAPDKAAYLMDPTIGAQFTPEVARQIQDSCAHGAQVQILVADGLSSTAVEANLPDLVPALVQGLQRHGLTMGTNLFVKYGRVRVMDEVSGLLKPEVTLILLGERPGLVTNESLSCYMTYKGYPGVAENVRTVVSNIYRQGTPPSEAGAYIADIADAMLKAKASGMDLKL
jgi:ethanolamine ammonia-lyase small subunit